MGYRTVKADGDGGWGEKRCLGDASVADPMDDDTAHESSQAEPLRGIVSGGAGQSSIDCHEGANEDGFADDAEVCRLRSSIGDLAGSKSSNGSVLICFADRSGDRAMSSDEARQVGDRLVLIGDGSLRRRFRRLNDPVRVVRYAVSQEAGCCRRASR